MLYPSSEDPQVGTMDAGVGGPAPYYPRAQPVEKAGRTDRKDKHHSNTPGRSGEDGPLAPPRLLSEGRGQRRSGGVGTHGATGEQSSGDTRARGQRAAPERPCGRPNPHVRADGAAATWCEWYTGGSGPGLRRPSWGLRGRPGQTRHSRAPVRLVCTPPSRQAVSIPRRRHSRRYTAQGRAQGQRHEAAPQGTLGPRV